VPAAAWSADLSLADIPERVRTWAKHLLREGVACGLIGAQHGGPADPVTNAEVIDKYRIRSDH
jgi:arylsulfatase A-like enzyme